MPRVYSAEVAVPLKRGSSKATFQSNLRQEVAAGKPPAQAAAIAYRVQRAAKKKGK